MIDRFNGLRLDAVIRRHHQYDEVSYFGPTRTHSAERLMPWCVEKSDQTATDFYLIRTNMLSNPTGLPGRHLGVAQIIEQRRFPMVYMPHDSHHRSARYSLKPFDFLLSQKAFGIIASRGLRGMTHFLYNQRRGVLIKYLVDRYQRTHLHEGLDHLGCFNRHRQCEVSDRNRLGYGHLMDNRCGRPLKRMLARRG